MSKSKWNNTYWGSYKQIEKRLLDLSHIVYIDDKQLEVYSSEIADLILSTSTKIESVIKDIFERHFYMFMIDKDTSPISKSNKNNFDIKKWNRNKWKYDFDCFREIENYLNLSSKEVIIDSPNFHFEKYSNVIKPFSKIDTTSGWIFIGGEWQIHPPRNVGMMFHNKLFETISWNKNYQSIKHNYKESLFTCANLKTLVVSLAALYLLLIYLEYFKSGRYINQEYITYEYLDELESEIFSVRIHTDTETEFFTNSLLGKQFEKQQKEEKDNSVLLRILNKRCHTKLIAFEQKYREAYPNRESYDFKVHEKFEQLAPKAKLLALEINRIMKFLPSDFLIVLNDNSMNQYDFHDFNWSDYDKSKYENKRTGVFMKMAIGDKVRFIDFGKEIIEGIIIDLPSNRISVKTMHINSYTTPLGNIVDIDIIE